MEILITILSWVMVIMAIFLVVAVLMQSGKDSKLSGTIAGGAETFFGKTKGKAWDRVLSKATTIMSIVFVVLVFLVYVLQGRVSQNEIKGSGSTNTGAQTEQTETVTEEETVTADETLTAEETETVAETVENETAESVTAENE
ncbi:MAG: preprotein translocase subunit SecG [Clostridia bacterium]|nr:preprotein translocase subunit SecG [Clostridia bacterium]